jgi:membrane protein implicated in regulation of membrane protease activity
MTWAWWIWISAGVLLVTAEAFLGSFVILWFGFGAVLSGLLTLLMPELHLGVQLLIAVLSGAVLMFLFRDRWVARGNAETDTLYTFSGGPGELKVSVGPRDLLDDRQPAGTSGSAAQGWHDGRDRTV